MHQDKEETIINEETLRMYLKQHLPINVILIKFKDFLHTPRVKNPLLNRMVTKAKLHPNYSSYDFINWFIEDIGYLVEGTTYGANSYTMRIFLKLVWESSLLSVELINNIKKNILLPTCIE